MLSRREFLAQLAGMLAIALSGLVSRVEEYGMKGKSKVFVIKTGKRESGVRELLGNFDLSGLSGKMVAIKANYNSADAYPASTHPDTLAAIVDSLKGAGAKLVLAERSGMGDTRDVLEEIGVMELARQKGFDVTVLDELKSNGWITVKPEKSHWKRGFLFPKVFSESDAIEAIVQTCCLKTHRYGGHFTLSLKNSVGMVAKYDPDDGYNYMAELHSSKYQRQMIAEINTAYTPEFVIMDAIKGFSRGGPDTGTLIEPGIMMASNDRVALDAAGVAVIRLYGTEAIVSKGSIFGQEQIARAAELGLGAGGADEIEIVPVNDMAQVISSGIEDMLGKA